MSRFRKKPVVIEAYRWLKNGDHPEDHRDGNPRGWEGKVVRYFRNPDYPGRSIHDRCGRTWHDHGWIDTRVDGGHTVCPGDWVITGVQGEHYPCKPDIFTDTYEPVESPS